MKKRMVGAASRGRCHFLDVRRISRFCLNFLLWLSLYGTRICADLAPVDSRSLQAEMSVATVTAQIRFHTSGGLAPAELA
ncbi:uncharacterized protein V1516DRAFT_680352 [Lipomyces oligophaga]|uniref:uncharacterized protein n=1 Tax=Lipomyces oligophaga TaxID=45792 RepID=UPI0034CFC10D